MMRGDNEWGEVSCLGVIHTECFVKLSSTQDASTMDEDEPICPCGSVALNLKFHIVLLFIPCLFPAFILLHDIQVSEL